VRYNALQSGKIERTPQRNYLLPLQDRRVNQSSRAMLNTCFSISLFFTLRMEALYSSETFIGFRSSTRYDIPRDGNLDSYRCENMKLNIVSVVTVITESFFVISPGTVSWRIPGSQTTRQCQCFSLDVSIRLTSSFLVVETSGDWIPNFSPKRL
jgi:hypothetical protein